MSELELVSMATEWVCPNTHIAITRYEKGMVSQLVRFGRAVLGAAEQLNAVDAAVPPVQCGCLAYEGTGKLCGYCNRPRR